MSSDDNAQYGIALDRQTRPVRLDARGRPLVPSRVPETKPTPLQNWFIYLSVVVLFCGVIVISALQFGAPLSDPIVRLPMLLGSVLLALVTIDATVRIWRSAWVWMPVHRGRGLFRLVWVVTLIGSLILLGLLVWAVVSA